MKSGRRWRRDTQFFVALTVAFGLISALLSVAGVLGLMNVGTCSPTSPCNSELSSTAASITPVVALALFVAVLFFSVPLRHAGKATWWLPAVAVVVIALAYVLAKSLEAAAVNGSLNL